MSAEPFESCVRQSDFSPKRLLASEFCSPGWIAASHVRRRDRHGRIVVCRKRGAYPVGGMVKCPVCGRSAPSDRSRELCVDCRVETDLGRFQERLAGWAREDHVELRRLYWRRPVRVWEWIREGMPMLEHALDAEPGPGGDDRDDGSLIHEADLFDGALESDQRWGNALGSREMLIRLRRRFLDPSVMAEGRKRFPVKLRGAGCQKVMLPESIKSLKQEIVYYKGTGLIVPSARRLNTPFDRREQALPMPGRPCGL